MDDPSHAQEERRKFASLAIEAVRKSLEHEAIKEPLWINYARGWVNLMSG